MSATEIVRVEGVLKRYGATPAVSRIAFDVQRGEMFGLIGPDGAGKTTTLRLILGLLAADEGRIVTCGVDPRREPDTIANSVGYLSQRFSLYGDLSIDENVEFFAAIHGVEDFAMRRDALLERLRLTPFRDRLADKLSGGMRQKLALACTLIHTPDLIVLDEPTTGVDPVSRRDFWRILAELQAEGLTILLTTPYLDEAERCGRVGLIDGGELLTVDTPDAIRRSAGGVFVELIAEPRREAAAALRTLADVVSVETFGERLHVTVRRAGADGGVVEGLHEALASRGFSVRAGRAIDATLEDVFIARMHARQAVAGRA